MTPTITTSKLILRPLTKATQRHIDWLRDPKVTEYSEQRHREHTFATCLRYIHSFVPDGHIWAISTTLDDRHIGNIAADVDRPNNTCDLSILIGDRDCWGKGFGRDAWRTVSEWLLNREGGDLRKVEAGCMAVNIPMRRVLDHTGFQFEGERKNHFLYKEGQPCGAVYYGRFR